MKRHEHYVLIPVSIGYGSGARLFCIKCKKPFELPPELKKHILEHSDIEDVSVRTQEDLVKKLAKMAKLRQRAIKRLHTKEDKPTP